jgi:FdhD protein
MWKTLTAASSYRETGGIHCAAIASATDEKPLAVFEDVGRHNAFDKAIGRMLLASFTPEEKILLTSGRISSEMALKAAHGSIPVVATITIGTDLAVRIAEDSGLTLVARVLNASPVVLCGEERIVYNEEPI